MGKNKTIKYMDIASQAYYFEQGFKAGQLQILQKLLEEVEKMKFYPDTNSTHAQNKLFKDFRDLINQKIQEIEK